jgi:predicted amidohydrolase YtcJ
VPAPPSAAIARQGVTVYHHGKVYTAAPGKRYAEALAVSGARIVRVGKSDDLLREFPGARRVNLKNRTLIPGINDAHYHNLPLPSATRLFKADPPLDPSKVEIGAAIAAEARKNPGRWIIVDVGINAAEDSTVDRGFLDAIAPASPVYLKAFYGHGHVINSKAIEALRIPEDVVDPVGGHFGRTKAGRLDGRVFEYAQWITARALLKLASDEDIIAGQNEDFGPALHFGITSMQNMSWSPADRYLRLAASNPHLPRLRWINWPLSVDEVLLPVERSVNGSTVSTGGIKWILDGSPLERGAAQTVAYADDPRAFGRLNFTLSQVVGFVRAARSAKQQILLHAVGSASTEEALTAFEQIPPEERSLLRPRIEHGDFLQPEQDEQLKRLSVTVVQNPTHFFSVELLVRRFGPERRAMRLASIIHAGVHVAFGSDGPLNPFLNIMMAITNPYRPSEAITREEAVDAYTRESAYAELAEAERGTLEAGKLADFAVLSQDIFTCPVLALPGTWSVLTIVGGKVLSGAESDL